MPNLQATYDIRREQFTKEKEIKKTMNELKEKDILDWIENLETTANDTGISWYKRKLENFKFEIDYWWNNSIMYPIRKFRKGISNLWKWRKIIWEDRWWDYYYLLEILRFKLKDMEEHWGRDTHYVEDYKEKDILKELIADLEWMLNEDNEFEDGYEEEYKKRSKSFFGRLDRWHRKFWD